LLLALLSPHNSDTVDEMVRSIVPPAKQGKSSNILSKKLGMPWKNRASRNNSKSGSLPGAEISPRKPAAEKKRTSIFAKGLHRKKKADLSPGKLRESAPANLPEQTEPPVPTSPRKTSAPTSPRESSAPTSPRESIEKESEVTSTQIFGAPIEVAVDRGTPESRESRIPLLMMKAEPIIREHAGDEGIFRLSGGHDKIQYWKRQFDLGEDPNLQEEVDIHVITGLLKLYLRELPEYLLTAKLAPNFEAVKRIDNPHVQVMYIKSLVEQLPEVNYCALYWLLSLLWDIIANKETNFMGVENLALIFSPTLKCSVNVIQILLQDFEVIFGMAE
ncbi:MAG: hypothetical protein NXI00_24495, partial [Cytophagales bacterium]|nr:hypothetical protein [Cytophagales bacterium]